MPGLGDHLIDRRTGRPHPHASWPLLRAATVSGWCLALGFLALAAYVYHRTRDAGLAIEIAGIAGLYALGTYVAGAALRRRQRRYSQALAAYDAALARAAEPVGKEGL